MLVWPINSSLSLSDPATRFIKVAKVWRQLWGVYFRRLTPSFYSIGLFMPQASKTLEKSAL